MTEEQPLTSTFQNQPDLYSSLLANSIRLDIPIAIYRLPEKDEVTVIAGKNKGLEVDPQNLESLQQGFILAPFSGKNNVSYIKADVLLTLSNNGLKKEIISDEELFSELYQKKESSIPFKRNESEETSQEQYEEVVNKAVKEITAQNLKKVVIARSKQVSLKDPDPGQAFVHLCEKFPLSFVSLVYHPSHGVWLGASPELLIAKDNKEKFYTVALAGTQKIENEPLAEAVWRQKEIEEQALVSRYIIDCFKAIRLRNYEEEGPKTIRAGSLLHLKTAFSVNTKQVGITNLASKMLALLHPTSAIGGMPKARAIEFIKKNERLDRGLFAGYWGPVSVFNETNLFVNIRTARLFQNAALLFAGAGITEESVPRKEFLETELKMESIGNIISNNLTF